jgi:hypothetical protein
MDNSIFHRQICEKLRWWDGQLDILKLCDNILHDCIVDAKQLRASLTVRTRHVGGRGDRKTIAQREWKHNHFHVLCDVKEVQAAEELQRRIAVSSKCFKVYYTCCWQSRYPLTLSIFFSLLLWHFLSSQLFCVHYTYIPNRAQPVITFPLLADIYKVKLFCYAMQKPRGRGDIAATHYLSRH